MKLNGELLQHTGPAVCVCVCVLKLNTGNLIEIAAQRRGGTARKREGAAENRHPVDVLSFHLFRFQLTRPLNLTLV